MIKLWRLASRSVTAKFLALTLVFLIVPVILYGNFAEADAERQAFLLRALQGEGRLLAQNLEPVLTRANGRSFLEIAKAVKSAANDQMRVKLLLRPAGQTDSFFLVAANPPLEPDKLDQERRSLTDIGVLPRLDESCDGDRALALRYTASSGSVELLTSMSPLHNAAGCWVVLTSFAANDLASASLARPFLQAPEVRMALGFYGLMALLIGLTVVGTLLDLRGFARLARRIRQGGAFGKPSFARIAAIPELLPVAREFDRMVATLDASASALREAAEDNAHAFKAPIAAVTQALEPLKQMAAQDFRAINAATTIEHALTRLNALVAAARRLDETAVEIMTARLQPVDLAAMARQMAQAYDRVAQNRAIRVIGRITSPAMVMATEESLETVVENLLDNAVSFAPADSKVTLTVTVGGGEARLTVEDEGPGVPADRLNAIFRRNFSFRPGDPGGDASDHSGIGLAIVRRTVELLGGEVSAANRPTRGFRVVLTLPTL